MESLRKHIFIAIAFVFLISAVLLTSITSTHGAPPADKDVKVINTTAEPVPTVAQGTTAVSRTVQAQQNGAWNVGIVGMPVVKIGSDPANPIYVRDVNGSKPQPFQQEVEVMLEPGMGGQNAGIMVPVGKLMVIKQVSASAFAPLGQKLLFSVLTHVTPDLTLRRNFLQTTHDSFGGSNFFLASQSVHIYADTPGAAVRVDRDLTTDLVTTTFVVSGYFIDK
jgi:hypothetical protein